MSVSLPLKLRESRQPKAPPGPQAPVFLLCHPQYINSLFTITSWFKLAVGAPAITSAFQEIEKKKGNSIKAAFLEVPYNTSAYCALTRT